MILKIIFINKIKVIFEIKFEKYISNTKIFYIIYKINYK